MTKTLASGLAFAVAVLPAVAQTVLVGGGQSLHVIHRGQPVSVLSVPFIKPAVAQGRLAAVDPVAGILTADRDLAATLVSLPPSFLLIRSGAARGAWFPVAARTEPGRALRADQLVVDAAAGTGELEELRGDESFSVHPRFSLGELFPPDGSVLPAAKFDVLAGQVRLYQGEATGTYWLSNGEWAARGWVDASLRRRSGADDVFLPPGVSFVVCHPNPVAEVDIIVAGIVPDVPLRKLIFPGYNFVAAEYSLARTDALARPSLKIEDLGLVSSGFRGADTPSGSDRLLTWDATAGDFQPEFWYRNTEQPPRWYTTADLHQPVGQHVIDPTRGLVVWHSGGGFLWTDGD